ncbi:MAG: hypothetical protein HYX91_03390 [Chloroflexi bacterium]|nr:hypothetical protein [Chloroflexota bacterium]
MITVTDSAKEILKGILEEHTDDPEVGLRLSPEPSGQLGLTLSKEEGGDQVVEHEATKVLLVSPELAPMVDGMRLDAQQGPEGLKLVMSKAE